MLTLAQFSQHFLRFSARTLSPGGLAQYEALLRLYLLPLLGDTPLDKLSTGDAFSLQDEMAQYPVRANKATMLLCRVVRVAAMLGHPVGTVLKPSALPGRQRQRYLSTEERARLRLAISRDASVSARVVELLVLTGMRKGEALYLRWAEVDLERGMLLLGKSKTGPSNRVLGRDAVELLASLPRAGEWVFPGHSGGHQATVQKTWERIRKEAQLSDVRMHDLRHDYASRAAAAGVPLLTIGRLLGHRSTSSTARYVHLTDQSLREAAERIAF